MKPYFLLFIISLFIISCTNTNKITPPDVMTILEKAGTNRSELEKVLENYAALGNEGKPTWW